MRRFTNNPFNEQSQLCGGVLAVACRLWLFQTAADLLTVEQHMKTIMKEPKTPPIPTIQVIRRKRITPKMFWIHGK